MLIISFEKSAWEDYLFWQQNDKQKLKKVNSLVKDILRTPFSGEGKPEPLKDNLAGFWSRRIDSEHRLVYKVQDEKLIIIQCRYHY
ncbi:MAG: Txe/YoeB family addiction module toxin [Alphaproteobacteria bacterium]|jgi:toxin YoeB|nr:Txe/YoeB family addiction module toxin [Alphaproteobacteria bacterium]